MEPEGSSPYTQEPATCPYPEPDQLSLRPPPNLSKFHFNIILPSTRSRFIRQKIRKKLNSLLMGVSVELCKWIHFSKSVFFLLFSSLILYVILSESFIIIVTIIIQSI
jgi:hypothetical protein